MNEHGHSGGRGRDQTLPRLFGRPLVTAVLVSPTFRIAAAMASAGRRRAGVEPVGKELR
jgi:hypothetical protein